MRFLSLKALAPLTLLWPAMPASAETLRFATGPFLSTPDATRASFDRLSPWWPNAPECSTRR